MKNLEIGTFIFLNGSICIPGKSVGRSKISSFIVWMRFQWRFKFNVFVPRVTENFRHTSKYDKCQVFKFSLCTLLHDSLKISHAHQKLIYYIKGSTPLSIFSQDLNPGCWMRINHRSYDCL